jgi:hypothetical protein
LPALLRSALPARSAETVIYSGGASTAVLAIALPCVGDDLRA